MPLRHQETPIGPKLRQRLSLPLNIVHDDLNDKVDNWYTIQYEGPVYAQDAIASLTLCPLVAEPMTKFIGRDVMVDRECRERW